MNLRPPAPEAGALAKLSYTQSAGAILQGIEPHCTCLDKHTILSSGSRESNPVSPDPQSGGLPSSSNPPSTPELMFSSPALLRSQPIVAVCCLVFQAFYVVLYALLVSHGCSSYDSPCCDGCSDCLQSGSASRSTSPLPCSPSSVTPPAGTPTVVACLAAQAVTVAAFHLTLHPQMKRLQ